jgi:hypothetical protein
LAVDQHCLGLGSAPFEKKAGLDAFHINFHGNRDLDQLLQSIECFMQDAAPMLANERIGSEN